MTHAWPVPILATADPSLPHIITVDTALAAGLTKDQVRQRVRSGRWTRVARGAYVRTAAFEVASTPFARAELVHRLAALANAQRHPGSVIAFHSAAIIHALPMWGRLPSSVALIVPEGHWTGVRGGVHFRRLPLTDRDLSSDVSGVTSVARTWLDVARTSRMPSALALGDAALRSGRLTMREAEQSVEESRGLRGIHRAERALTHLSAMRETPLESASWAYFVRYGLPLPTMQAVIVDDGGNFIARVDFLWEQFGLVGECDGRMKYSGPDVVYAEKRREDGIRQRGHGMVRWGSPDLLTDALARRLGLLLR